MILPNHLHLYNSLSRQKEKFTALHAPFVGMYVCGPTVYNYVHLGNCRTFVNFDLIRRYLLHLGYQVRFVRNITDAGHLENDADHGEDKIAQKARLEKLEPMEIVQKYTLHFHEMMRTLNVLAPSIEPTATGHIVEQIQMTQDLIDKGFAYVVNGSVYFDVKKYHASYDYGVLSGRNIEELQEGSRQLEGQEEKRDALDFALWKKASPRHIMHWASPWSEGFPGWHLECSAMSTKYLGDTFDIHGGGLDLKFPHHECEMAQCRAHSGQSQAKFWLHANLLTVNGYKMSKSLGNTLSVEDILEGNTDLLHRAYTASVLRFFMLCTHYRSVMDFSSTALDMAEKNFQKLQDTYETLLDIAPTESSSQNVQELVAQCYQALDDDLNTPLFVARLLEIVKFVNVIKQGKGSVSEKDLLFLQEKFKAFTRDILGLVWQEKAQNSKADEFIDLLLDIRQDAKATKNFALSDTIRQTLVEKGVIIQDGKEKSTWKWA
jgi:cysteinyl-tRNA synthetase